jgi:hypothetical protein
MRRLLAFTPALLATTLSVLFLAPPAAAQSGSDTATTARRQAARKFAEGTRAFDSGDFLRAGEAFDAAYALAPHPDALWNSARAWHKAGELARAANLYARYLREAPEGAPDRPGALTAQKQLASRLARIEIHSGEGVTDVRIDGTPVDAATVYVVPGVHSLRARSGNGPVAQETSLGAGADVSIVLEAPAEPPPHEAAPRATVELSPAQAPPRGAEAEPAPRAGLSPTIVIVEGVVTLVTAGVTVWSGLDTLSTLDTFKAHPTRATLESGRSEEARTNVLIGVSAGLAVITAVTASFLVDWHAPRRRVGLGLGPTGLSGSF